MSETQPFLQVKNIYKSFGHVEALRGVNMEAYTGEVLALVGDNGAGKSTLIKTLSGAVWPDCGEIWLNNQKYSRLKPKQAIKIGLSTVYQDLALANTRDVPCNIFMGRELRCGILLNKKAMYTEAQKLIGNLGIKIPSLAVPVSILSGGQRQGVAVARAIHQGGKILIFDEPTAAMGLVESAAVLKLIKNLAEQGFGVIIISHNLEQVFQVANRVCVMRQGKVVNTVRTADVCAQDVVSMITGALETNSNLN
ncbi:MAG: ATP-binding cassette domain-containing protein [Clostridia bacterium]|jgi:ABC-type sugar transport system ATPase subunit|nr:ATP-binding cassette domain-containing protein [Clostridia bacterium]